MAEEPSVKPPPPVETMDTAVEPLAPPSDAQQQQQQQIPAKASRRHRRVASEDLTQSNQNAGGAGYYQYPPKQISYNVSDVSPKNGGGAPPFPPSGSNRRPRSGSWSGMPPPSMQQGSGMPPPSMQQGYPPQQYQQYPSSPGYPSMGPPMMMAYSPAGNPIVPFIVDPNQSGGGGMLPPQAGQYDNPRRKRKGDSAGHRRVHSYSGGGTGYGSMFEQPPPPPPAAPPVRRGSGDFSPRTEILKLAGFRNTSSPLPPSPRNGGPSPPNYPHSPRQSALRSNGSFYKSEEGRGVSFSPGTPVLNGAQSARGNLGVYGMDPSPYNMDPSAYNMTPSAVAAMQAPLTTSSGRGDSIGGEAVFLAQKKNKHRKTPSRKMHMRQQSAQLFMEDIKGSEQQPKCRDVTFLLLFLFHILGIVYLGNTYGYEALRFHDELESETSVTIIYRNVVYVACLSGIFAVTISALALLLMTAIARKLVQAALMLTITLSFFWGTVGIGLSPKMVVPATGIIALALSIAYTFIVWDRIPFASANLNAALSGIRANPGAVLIAFFFQFLSLAWSIYYTFMFVGVYDAVEAGEWNLTHPWKIALYCGLGMSYYWTYHVCLNIVQVTVAGVIGSWWFSRDGDVSTRRGDLNRAFFRSIFYAFGSICFGSLFVGPVRLLRQLSAFFRPSEDRSTLLCLHECLHCIQTLLTRCVDSLSNSFSPWAFTYVGLYGYDLISAGEHSAELFAKRGWTTIVSDDLVPNVLLMTSGVIGGVTGLFAHLVENMEVLSFSSLNEPDTTSFVLGVAVGLVVTSVLFGIISSSVNAVIVCFAASPVDFEQNHPELSQDMRTAWREVWPGCMDVVDLRVAAANYAAMDPMAAMNASLHANKNMSEGGEHAPLLGVAPV